MVESWADKRVANLGDSMVGLMASLLVDLMAEQSVAPPESRLARTTAALTVASKADH